MSLLGEVPRLGGFVRTRGKLGFVPQTNWIFSATFRENIMFGLEMDRRKYNKVLYACDLVKVSNSDTLSKNLLRSCSRFVIIFIHISMFDVNVKYTYLDLFKMFYYTYFLSCFRTLIHCRITILLSLVSMEHL